MELVINKPPILVVVISESGSGTEGASNPNTRVWFGGNKCKGIVKMWRECDQNHVF